MATLRSRFEEKHTPDPNTGCWLWMASVDRHGYGQIQTGTRASSKVERAHRVSFKLHRHEISPDQILDHKCNVRPCVNPDYLQVTTIGDNVTLGWLRAQGISESLLGKVCRNGHDLRHSYVRTRKTKMGERQYLSCRICQERAYARYASRRVAP